MNRAHRKRFVSFFATMETVKLLFSIVAFLFIFSPELVSQTYTLSGSVRDSVKMEPLPGAIVRVLNSSKGTVTNSDGIFSLSLSMGSYRIAVSYLGFESETLHIELHKSIEKNIFLSPLDILIP